MQREGLARFPGLGGLLAVPAARDRRLAVRPERRRVVELGEEVLQGLLADPADPLGRQGEAATFAVDETLVL